MNTPAHLVLNALVLGRSDWRPLWLPISLGALVPDLPMVLFYLYQRGFAGTPERVIWAHSYFEPSWQAFFDVFNSLPLIAIGAAVAWRARAPAQLAFFASMALHCLADLPVHREDAHAHFYPFTSWRFESPVSYWDPAHHGLVFAGAEALLVLGGAVALWRFSPPRAWRVVGALSAAVYLVLGAVVLTLWTP
ncbi:MAG: hypothetical protein JRG76_15705 [Deltaproteobacteria bacterium]|nr:hypothetical protein [Deltaproteobacteria bacterium]MBW2415944.1 hypothetical protein [Deltaproteobacteria bacterium]